jgi:HrpA-like RNA helicase
MNVDDQGSSFYGFNLIERVAAERCEKIGNTVGYAIRGETKVSPDTRLQFVTTGVLLRRIHSDPTLESISHVLIDEVHERSGKTAYRSTAIGTNAHLFCTF